jgi:ferredoxin
MQSAGAIAMGVRQLVPGGRIAIICARVRRDTPRAISTGAGSNYQSPQTGIRSEPEIVGGSGMKVVVNWSLCDGNGNCAAAAPEIFALDDDDQLEILRESFGEELRDKAETAVRSCPKNALSLEDR